MTKGMNAEQQLVQFYKDDPVFYFEHALGFLTWSKSREIINSVRDNKKTIVTAAHGTAKSHTAAGIAIWFYNCHLPSRVITTAPVFAQVQGILWPKIKDAYRSANIELIGETQDVRVRDPESEEHLMLGFSTNESARAEGHHEWNILWVFDEAKGIDDWMWDSAEGAMTGGKCRILAISTTDGIKAGSKFHDCCRPDSGWNRIEISCYDSPFYTGERFRGLRFPDKNDMGTFTPYSIAPEDTRIQIVDKDKIKMEESPATGWGKDSPIFHTKMEGKLIDRQAGQIIPISSVDQMYRNNEDKDFSDDGLWFAGIDVAWGGDADTVIWKRKGYKILDYPLIITSQDLPKRMIAQYMGQRIDEYLEHKTGEDGYTINIDGGGVGEGLVSILEGLGYMVNDIKFGGSALDNDSYFDMASELWIEGAKTIDLAACPRFNRLTSELTSRMERAPEKSGKRRVESKKEYSLRGYRSPDVADAFLLLWPIIIAAYIGNGGGKKAY